MSDAMILPCGHTFGTGEIEQVKQMIQSFMSFITVSSFTLCYSILFSCAYEICFFPLCSLRKLAALVGWKAVGTTQCLNGW